MNVIRNEYVIIEPLAEGANTIGSNTWPELTRPEDGKGKQIPASVSISSSSIPIIQFLPSASPTLILKFGKTSSSSL